MKITVVRHIPLMTIGVPTPHCRLAEEEPTWTARASAFVLVQLGYLPEPKGEVIGLFRQHTEHGLSSAF